MTKRRSRGEGSIYRRKDGLWCAQIILPNGKRKDKYAKSQKEVRDWLDSQKNSVHQGVWTDSDSLTVEVFLNHYLNDIVAHNLRPKTQESYFGLVRLHILPELGKIKLTSLRPDHVQALYALKAKEGYSKRTIQYIHAVLHKALDQAVKWGLVPRNVCEAVQAPRPAKNPMEILTQEQANKLLAVTQNDPLHALWVAAITTGMRKEELAGLRWVDVNLEKKTIQIQQVALTVYQKGIIISEPKSEESRRTIELSKATVDALRVHKEKQERIKESSSEWEDYGLVFCSKKGRPIGSRNLLKYFHVALEKAGLPKVTFHSLRHLHATLLLVAGVHPKIVQERLGHSRIDITLDLYTHVIPGLQKPAADIIDTLITA